ncbi:MAG: DUF47 domain-containing protein [Acidimicrobiales bacterium]
MRTTRSRLARLRHAHLWRDLGRVSGSSLVDLLVQHVKVALEGANFAASVLGSHGDQGDVVGRMEEIEHEGDRWRKQLVEGLSKALVTPIDREDMFRLSRSIDDVLDNIADFVREWDLYRPADSRLLLGLLSAVADGLQQLALTVEALTKDPGTVTQAGLPAKKSANQVRRRYQLALAKLYAGELSVETLKARDLLRRLDVVGLRLNEAADFLLDASVKRGY